MPLQSGAAARRQSRQAQSDHVGAARGLRERGLHGRAHACWRAATSCCDASSPARSSKPNWRRLILDGLGLKADVFVRDADQLDAIIAANPFKAFAKTTPTFLVVNFMRGPATPSEMEAMEKTALTGEEIKQGKDCLYIKFPERPGPVETEIAEARHRPELEHGDETCRHALAKNKWRRCWSSSRTREA